MRTAVALFADGRTYDAIRIAHAYAQAHGGRIATLPDLFQLIRAQPQHPIFDSSIVTDSFMLLGSERRRRRRYFRGNVVHGSGLLADPELRTWFDERHSLMNKTVVPGVPRQVQAITLPADRWQALRSSGLWCECGSVKVAHVISAGSKKKRRASVLDRQTRALMGQQFRELIKYLRASTPQPSVETHRYKYDVWRRGSVGAALFNDVCLKSDSFRAGRCALASPLKFLRPSHDHERVTIYHWEPAPAQVLAIPRDWQPSDPIVLDRFPGGLTGWITSREDCFHPSEEAFSGEVPYFLGKERSSGRYFAHRVCKIMDGNRVVADRDPLVEVEVETVLGETTLPEVFDGAPLELSEYQALLDHMPSGTQGILIDAAEDAWEHSSGPWGGFSCQQNVPVRFVKLRPLHARRFLTVTELLANPNEYLRRIGVGV